MAFGQGERSVPRGRRSLFYWSEDTAAKHFDTGVQRVVRCLGRALHELRDDLGTDVIPVGWDADRRLLRVLDRPECRSLGIDAAARTLDPRPGDWLLVPEVPARVIGDGSDPVALGHAFGLRVAALVHDLIPITHQSLYEPAVVDFYSRYYGTFAAADLVLVTTRHVGEDLERILQAAKRRVPEIVVCALAAELPGVPRRLCKPPLPEGPLRLLTVSRWEPRKNLPRLLGALEMLAGGPHLIRLAIVGRRGGYPAYEAEVEARLGRLPNVTVCTDVDDRLLVALHEAHHATAYPSYEEGFGLPILESLWLATPCLCHAGSAMAEIAPGGGTVLVDMLDEVAIADVLAGWAAQPEILRGLRDEAIGRDLRTWSATAREVAAALGLLPAISLAAGKTRLDLGGGFC